MPRDETQRELPEPNGLLFPEDRAEPEDGGTEEEARREEPDRRGIAEERSGRRPTLSLHDAQADDRGREPILTQERAANPVEPPWVAESEDQEGDRSGQAAKRPEASRRSGGRRTYRQ